jgi:hypothetical protein
MKTRAVITALLILLGLAFSCGREKPTVPDGNNNIMLYAVDTSGVQGGWVAIEGATIRVSSSTSQYERVFETGPGGFARLDGLVAGTYMLQAELINMEENYTILGQKELSVLYDPQTDDTVFMDYKKASPLTMNEIYYCGCNYGRFYYYDQFIELYNSSADTLWLDGYIVCRTAQSDDVINIIGLETVDYALAYYVFAFPGESGVTRTIPLAPEEFLVLAGDATNHTAYGGALCVDLRDADWEFFNPLGSDYDAPGVPNLLPLSNYENDFQLNVGHTGVFIATGEEWEYVEHFDPSMNAMKEYIHVPLSTVVDGVEYSSNTTVTTRYLTLRVDAGLAGNGMAKYSATSVQRRFPGLDSNNSTFDFENTQPPSPGWQ